MAKNGIFHDLAKQVRLFCNFDVAVADLLDDHEDRITKLEEALKRQAEKHDGLHTRVIENEMAFGSHLRGKDNG